jgi:LuxR family maltose regulon positive regulatory protein
VDDHGVTRTELAALLNKEQNMEVVGEACDGKEAVDLANEMLPDVVIMDVFMPVQNGIDATRQIVIEHPDIKVIGFSMHTLPDIAAAMKKAGAAACISKSDPIEVLIEAIQTSPPENHRSAG